MTYMIAKVKSTKRKYLEACPEGNMLVLAPEFGRHETNQDAKKAWVVAMMPDVPKDAEMEFYVKHFDAQYRNLKAYKVVKV